MDAPEPAAPATDSRPAQVAAPAKPHYELAGRAERLGPTWLTRARVERTISLLSPLLLLLIWEIAAWFGKIDTRFFPAPSAIFAEAGQMIRTGELWIHFSISMTRIVIGFLLGAIPGILIGLATGLFSPVRAVVQPLVDATFPIPKIAILPLFIMTLGLGEESKYAIIATGVIYFVLINTAAGVRNIDRIYLDVGKNYGAGRWMMFMDVALPGAMPLIMAGLKLGMGVALLVIVSAEFVGAKSGIGYMIWTSWQVFQVEKMYVGLLVCAALGFGLSYLLEWAERLLIPWKPRQG